MGLLAIQSTLSMLSSALFSLVYIGAYRHTKAIFISEVCIPILVNIKLNINDVLALSPPPYHPYGFYCSWNLTSANSMQVANISKQ